MCLLSFFFGSRIDVYKIGKRVCSKKHQLSKNVSTDSLKQLERYYRTNFRDSFTEKPYLDLWITTYDYKSINQNQLNLGLDLKGGMSFVLEVNQGDILRALSNNSKDPIFNKAIDQAIQAQASSQDNFSSLLLKAYNDLDPKASMAPIFATNQKYAEKLRLEIRMMLY